MTIQTKLRKWGNSFGVVIPSKILNKKDLKEGQEVVIEITKKEDLRKIFGSLRDWKINSQEMKEQSREDWGD